MKTRDRNASEIEDFFRGSERERNAVWSAGHQSLATLSNLGMHRFVSCVIDSAPTGREVRSSKWFANLFTRIPRKGTLDNPISAAGFNTEIIEFIRKNYGHSIEIAALK